MCFENAGTVNFSNSTYGNSSGPDVAWYVYTPTRHKRYTLIPSKNNFVLPGINSNKTECVLGYSHITSDDNDEELNICYKRNIPAQTDD